MSEGHDVPKGEKVQWTYSSRERPSAMREGERGFGSQADNASRYSAKRFKEIYRMPT